MKKIILSLALSISLFGADLDKPFMTEQMLDNDLETHEYQLFYTKTLDIPLKGLTPKVIFRGKIDEYYDFFKKDMVHHLNISNEAIAHATGNALNTLQHMHVENYLNNSAFKNAGESFGISLLMQPIAVGLFGDDQYVEVTDYYEGETPKTRVIKYIVSDESLPEEELSMIYNTAQKSYHFNRGKAVTALMHKEYIKARKTLNRSQK